MKLPRLTNLHLTLVITIVVPLLLISGVGVYLGLSVMQEQDEERMQEDLALIARATQFPLSRAMESGDLRQVNETIFSIFAIGRVYGASVYDRHGERISQVGVVDRDVRRSRSAADAVALGDELGAFRQVEGESVFSHFTPLFSSDGRIIGLLQITRKRDDFDDRLASFREQAWWIWSMIAGAIMLVAMVGHYGGVGRHVSRLLDTMNQVRPDGERIRANPAGPREVQQIAEGLNRMLDRLEAAERELREQQEREVDLNLRLQHQEKMAMIGRVAGGVAHELGAPLSVIEGRARILQRTLDHPDAERQIEDIRAQVDRMTGIIRQLLDCFRHTPPNGSAPVSVAELTHRALDTLRASETFGEVRLHAEEIDPALRILGDTTRAELALSNILRNALHAAHERVALRASASEDQVQLRVEDDGPGIPEQDLERIFEPFYTTKAAGEGTGLGLAVVKSVMQEHGGDITVGNSPGGGCAVTLTWPRATVTGEAS